MNLILNHCFFFLRIIQLLELLNISFSFSFLWGPMNHIKHLFSVPRLPFTTAYIGTILATLYFSLWVNTCSNHIKNFDSLIHRSIHKVKLFGFVPYLILIKYLHQYNVALHRNIPFYASSSF